MGDMTLFSNGFSGIDTGVNPAKVPDGKSPDCDNWFPDPNKFGIHGVRKGSTIFDYLDGQPVRHIHIFQTSDLIQRGLYFFGSDDTTIDSGDRASSEETRTLLGTFNADFSYDITAGTAMQPDLDYYAGSVIEGGPAFNRATFTLAAPATDTYSALLGDSNNPIALYSYLEYDITKFDFSLTMGVAQMYAYFNATAYLIGDTGLTFTGTSPGPNYDTALPISTARIPINESGTDLRVYFGMGSGTGAPSDAYWDVSIALVSIEVYGIIPGSDL